MNTLYVIPARGGSKGIPRKNIKLFNGKPLIYHAIDCARELTDDKHICVSTDDITIKQVVEDYQIKVPFIRPLGLATDNAGMNGVLLHAIEYYENIGIQYDGIVLLQPTSPFRKVVHVKEAFGKFNLNVDMVTSVFEATANPYYNLFEEDENGCLQQSKTGVFVRRQDAPKVWEMNGAIYIINVKSLKEKGLENFTNIKKYKMEKKDSIDLDSMLDWEMAELIIKKGL